MGNYKEIKEFPNYLINNTGKIWSIKRKQYLKPYYIGYGGKEYLAVGLYTKSKRYQFKVHKLILETFVGPCPDNMECCHRDGNRFNNKLENLRWDTRKENIKDSIKHGTHQCLRREEQSANHKLTKKEVTEIRQLHSSGYFSQRHLGEIYNIHPTMVSRIIKYKNWI